MFTLDEMNGEMNGEAKQPKISPEQLHSQPKVEKQPRGKENIFQPTLPGLPHELRAHILSYVSPRGPISTLYS